MSLSLASDVPAQPRPNQPTIFYALDETEARAERHDRQARALEKEILLLGGQLELWARDADSARRATGQLREKVAASIASWERSWRRTQTERLARSPQTNSDTYHLLAHAQAEALSTYSDDFALLRSVSEGGDRIETLFVHQSQLIVELAQHRAGQESAGKERETLLAQARSGAGQAQVEGDLDRTDQTLTGALEDLPKNPTTDDFHRLKGTLVSPVSASPVHTFGPRKQAQSLSFVRHTGHTYAVPMNTPVRAVAPGEVVFAGRMEGYGNIAIIDHGSGYHTLYAHLDTLSVTVGQRLARMANIGASGESGSIEGPKFYFELRHQGRPIDPGPWFLKS